ncbi:class I SAM-dependent methyltransferase [Ectothiorhodospira mobilis]|uniref:class I SAM-dependent methyltransferase n=1 Tax=Ectothiorhodospira mobilis TaxID=195064 RepID=UPI001EE8893C|nr:class I SAM-dependent methyltransferase [Ectothiorhodospira mobilis]MCG5534725.1 methyltransferase domain-containing protein [Ectothiorhodospira mobilis]
MPSARERDALARRYAEPHLLQRLRRALAEAGLDPERLSCDAVAAIDQLHVGGRRASRQLADRADLRPGARILDLGCGTGGSSRLLMQEYGARVVGVDITQDYLAVAQWLNQATGLAEECSLMRADASHLPFGAASFDGIWVQHTFMNVPDMERALAEVVRVLRPGGHLWLHEVIRGEGGGPLSMPVPWADEVRHSHLLTAEALRVRLQAAGLQALFFEDISQDALAWRSKHTRREADSGGPRLSPVLIFGPRFLEMGRNVMENLKVDRIRIVQAIFRRGDDRPLDSA